MAAGGVPSCDRAGWSMTDDGGGEYRSTCVRARIHRTTSAHRTPLHLEGFAQCCALSCEPHSSCSQRLSRQRMADQSRTSFTATAIRWSATPVTGVSRVRLCRVVRRSLFSRPRAACRVSGTNVHVTRCWCACVHLCGRDESFIAISCCTHLASTSKSPQRRFRRAPALHNVASMFCAVEKRVQPRRARFGGARERVAFCVEKKGKMSSRASAALSCSASVGQYPFK